VLPSSARKLCCERQPREASRPWLPLGSGPHFTIGETREQWTLSCHPCTAGRSAACAAIASRKQSGRRGRTAASWQGCQRTCPAQRGATAEMELAQSLAAGTISVDVAGRVGASRQIQHGSAIVQGRGCPEPRSASSSSNSSAYAARLMLGHEGGWCRGRLAPRTSRLNSPPPSAERACHIRRSSAPEAARRRETGRRAERGRSGTSLRAEASGTPVKPSRASRQRASSTLAARASPEADARLPGGGAPCNASSLAAAGDGSRAWPRRSSVLAGRQSGLCFLELVGVTLDPATA